MSSPTVRRWTHLTLAAATLAMFAPRTQAGPRTAVDVEVSPYGGASSGELPGGGVCAFAPSVATSFGGVGGRVRVRRRAEADDPTTGWSASVQGAVEYQSHTLRREGSSGERTPPPNQTMLGGSLRLGGDWRYVGFHAGVGVSEAVGQPEYPCSPSSSSTACGAAATYPRTVPRVFPDVGIRFGRSDGWHGVFLVGVPNLATFMRPGVHGGAGYTSRDGHEFAARLGLQSNYSQVIFSNSTALRFDVSGVWPVGRYVGIGGGFAFLTGDDRLDWDLRGSLVFHTGR